MTVLRSLDGRYGRVLVAVDNSKHSEHAVRTAVSLAKPVGATLVGFHAYAARLHESRFLQMEPGLPERYSEGERDRQRAVHESLIAKGLRLISESYLERAGELARAAGVAFEARLSEGRHYQQIIREARARCYDLVVLGARGLGARRRTMLGSVCERVVRTAPCDVLVAREGCDEARGIVAAVDGSPSSYQALAHALTLGEVLAQPVEVVTVYDPQFHIVAFRRLAKVLSEEAAAAFRFKEQERLHAEIIDKGLERLYRGHLDRARDLAVARGQTVETRILAGKAFQSILDHVERVRPWLVVVGRFGQHATEGLDIGSTAENLVRLAPCGVLVVSAARDEPTGRPQEEPRRRAQWTPEAEARLACVSPFARQVVAEAVEAYAERQGHPAITPAVLEQAREAVGW